MLQKFSKAEKPFNNIVCQSVNTMFVSNSFAKKGNILIITQPQFGSILSMWTCFIDLQLYAMKCDNEENLNIHTKSSTKGVQLFKNFLAFLSASTIFSYRNHISAWFILFDGSHWKTLVLIIYPVICRKIQSSIDIYKFKTDNKIR